MRLKDEADYLICEYCETPHFPDPNSDGVRVLGVAAAIFCPVCAIALTHASVARERMFYCERCRGMLIGMGVFVEIVDDLRSRREISVDAARPADWKDLEADSLSEVQRNDGHASLLRAGEYYHRHVRDVCAELAGLRRARPGGAGAGSGGAS
jgi:Zn-finger nucleic acid-binding protein